MEKKIEFHWCALCVHFTAICPTCGNNSCNGGGEDCCTDAYAIADKISIVLPESVQMPESSELDFDEVEIK